MTTTLEADQSTTAASAADDRRADGANDDGASDGARAASFLGYFSIGLGLAELLVPLAMARVIGVTRPDGRNVTTLRTMGLREIGSGVAILATPRPTTAVWSRVAGDALDLALLGRALANPANDRRRTLFATANVLAVAALDVVTARRLSRSGGAR